MTTRAAAVRKIFCENVNGDDISLLNCAIVNNDLPKVKKLLSQGVDINKMDSKGRAPLHAVVLANDGDSHFEMAETLLKNGADVNQGRYTAMDVVAYTANLKFFRLFLDFGAKLNPEVSRGESTLLFAAVAYNHNVEVTQFLVEDLGLDVNHRNAKDRTALHLVGVSAGYCNIKSVKYLIKMGADINALDHRGRTPLSYALHDLYFLVKGKETNEKNFKFLMEHSDVNVINTNGDNILSFKRKSQHLCRILLKHLAKLQTLDDTLVHSSLLETIARNSDYNDYYGRCKEELLLAKSIKLKNSWVSYYHLLVGNKRRLKNYAGNKDLIEDFKKSNKMEKFPIYGSWMDENIRKGIKRRQVFDESAILLSKCLPIYDSYHLTIRDILDCLATKDLTKLCDKKRKRNVLL